MEYVVKRTRFFLDLALALRRFAPEPLQVLLKPIYRRWRQKQLTRDLDAAVIEWKGSLSQRWLARETYATRAAPQSRGRVLVVIVSYEALDCLRLCLSSIWGNTNYSDYHVVVVDNASSPAVLEYLQQEQERQTRLTVIRNPTNLGFARANNIGLASTAYDFAVLLNNDTIVTPGWLSGLIAHLEDDPTLGMVGPTTNWANNQARIPVPYYSLHDLESFSEQFTSTQPGRRQEVATLAMFCVALPRHILQIVGPLDESFGLGLFEDDDYAMRLHRAGYRLAVARDVFVHHWGWASFGNLTQKAYDQLFALNQARFEAKWGKWIRPAPQFL